MELQRNRYLWMQLAGLAAVPLLLDICLVGLASTQSDKGLPSAFGLQFWAIAVVGIVPALAMQCLKPFYIFSLPPLALKPSALTEDQRRCLKLLESWQVKALAIVSAGGLLWLLKVVYTQLPRITPLMMPKAGLVSAVVAFFFACTFLQISVSSVRLILIDDRTLARVTPYDPMAIADHFLILGWPVRKILSVPETVAPAPATPVTSAASDSSVVSSPIVPGLIDPACPEANHSENAESSDADFSELESIDVSPSPAAQTAESSSEIASEDNSV